MIYIYILYIVRDYFFCDNLFPVNEIVPPIFFYDQQYRLYTDLGEGGGAFYNNKDVYLREWKRHFK